MKVGDRVVIKNLSNATNGSIGTIVGEYSNFNYSQGAAWYVAFDDAVSKSTLAGYRTGGIIAEYLELVEDDKPEEYEG